MKKKQIGIVTFDYPLGYQALTINSALMLEREGYEVHIFIDAPSYEEFKISFGDFGDKNIIIHPIDKRDSALEATSALSRFESFITTIGAALQTLPGHGAPLRSFYRQAASLCWKFYLVFYELYYNRGSSCEKLKKQASDFFPDLFDFQQRVAESLHGDYVCLLGIDQYGLIAATMASESGSYKRRMPIFYFSMELLLKGYLHTLRMQVLSSLERSCIKSCYCVVIQDEKRAEHFVADNRLPQEKLVYLPVSGLRAPYRAKSDYLRELFGIRHDKRILLYAGAIMDYGMCLELVEAANNWGDDLVLILHSPVTPQSIHFDPAYVDEVKRASRDNKVYLSLNPVPWEKLPELISSADIGLMFYKEKDPNFLEIGRSSNKLVQYLQAGLPIITVDFPSLRSVTKACRCGESAHSPDEIEALARNIFANYDVYRNHAFECYQTRYRIADYFDDVLDRIRQIG